MLYERRLIKNMVSKRKDNKGRILEKGESQKSDLTYTYRWTDELRQRHSICAKTLNELREKEKKITIERSLGIIRSNTTVEELVYTYLDGKIDIADSTLSNYWWYYHHMIEGSTFGRMHITDVKKIDVKHFYTRFYKDGVKKGTLKWLQRILSPAFRMAVDNDYLMKNPCDRVLDEFRSDEKEKQILTIEQEIEFLERIKNTPKIRVYLTMYKIELLLGLRVGELTGLTWKDVDFKNKTIDINHQLQYRYINGEIKKYITRLKTNSSKRVLPMNDELYELFKEHRIQWLGMQNRNINFELDGYRDFVFLSHRTGEPLYPANIGRQMRNIRDREKIKVDLPDDLSPHSLRHCFVTRMAEAGCDIRTLMYLSGHSKVDTLMKIYNHVDTDRIKRDVEKATSVRNSLRSLYA